MGLAAPKNRSRISNDPQNTTWANNTTRFGHKILTSQGWTPGGTLGAKDASHSKHYTAASTSHIRVLLKDDNLGLGAKHGSERPENFGLAGLESILGRLNGREGEVKQEEERREAIERKGWVARKYGFMNFVSGGFLVGEKIERGIKREDVEKVEIKVEVKEEGKELVLEEKKVTKRKRTYDEGDKAGKERAIDEEPRLKRKKKSMNLREVAAEDEAAEQPESKSKSKKEKRDKKKPKLASASDPGPTEMSIPESPNLVSEKLLSDKAKRKVEKRKRKEEKRLKKALKKAAKEANRSNATAGKRAAQSSSSEDEDTETPTISSVPTTGTSTPVGLAFGAGGRHAVRQRYIRQKKMASMDPQALKEIFMIKTPS